ncbi:carbohydrate-binding domain-containing protein [Enterococcus rotai]|uniref:carbohydrate-binding domain-containing protein n=1 Tax=Enterococcus rotai TaxID=118060 RepID=UPI0035C70880
MVKIKNVAGVLFFGLSAGLLAVAGGQKAFAAELLTANTDLNGYAATVTTKPDGTNVLTTKKGEYLLNENASLYSSKIITITLNNTKPVNMGAINAKRTLEFRGNGELNVNTNQEVGINVGDHLKAFKFTKYGKGHVTANAAGTGIFVHNEIQMDGGTVEGVGTNYGVYSENDIKPYNDAVLKGTSSEGTGIYAYRDIYAWKGATVVGEGKVSGARSIIAHIQAEGAGSSITGISTDINSSLSALHADKQMLRAYSGAVVREEYRKPAFEITEDVPVFVTDFTSVARNMRDMKNYTWVSEPDNVFLNEQGGLLGDTAKGTPKELKIIGSRQESKLHNKNEVSQIKLNGKHEVIFSETPTGFTIPVLTKYWVFDNKAKEYVLYDSSEHNIDVNTIFHVKDYGYTFGPEDEVSLQSIDKEDFLVEKNDDEYVVNYYYRVDFSE